MVSTQLRLNNFIIVLKKYSAFRIEPKFLIIDKNINYSDLLSSFVFFLAADLNGTTEPSSCLILTLSRVLSN